MSLTAAQAELASFTQVRTGSAVPELYCTGLHHALPVAEFFHGRRELCLVEGDRRPEQVVRRRTAR